LGSLATWAGIDPDEAYDALARRGVAVPPRRPGVVPTPLAPPGARVYTPREHRARRAFSARKSCHRLQLFEVEAGYCFLDAEDDIDLAEMVRGAVSDPTFVEVVPMDEADARDAEAHAAAGERL
jgi:hypothetical protein